MEKTRIFVTKPVSMKNPVVAIISLLIVSSIAAQRDPLYVSHSEKSLFIEHKVSPKESFYSIGRLYTVHPKAIASFNRLDMNKGLAIGQSLRIPLTDSNFIQKGNTGVPLYYKPSANESLATISTTHRNVSVDMLKSWNGLSANNIDPGTPIVVGFLVTKEIPAVTLTPAIKPESNKDDAVAIAEKKTDPVVIPEKKTEPAKEVTASVKKEETPSPVVEKPMNEPVQVQKTEAPAQFASQTVAETGYFTPHFQQQSNKISPKKNETVTAGVFKTTSGWLDGKYYVLINGVQPGMIIRITNPATNKHIYAKVLGEMSGISQNNGLDIRISTASASALQITEQDKFIVKVLY